MQCDSLTTAAPNTTHTHHTTPTMAPTLKVTYFGIPGKAEGLRLLAALAGLDIEDKKIDFAAWGALKPTVAPQQLPLLEVDGETFGQSLAQQRYLATLAGLYPSDPLEALRVDEIVDYVADFFLPIGKTFAITDQAEKEAARAKAVGEGGDAYKWAQFLDQRLAGKKYAVGDALSLADVVLFTAVPFLKSGFIDGIPNDWDAGFKNLKAHKELIGAEPKVAAYYANAEGPWAVYKQ